MTFILGWQMTHNEQKVGYMCWCTCVGVHHCISVIIHKLKGLTAILSKIVCNHCTSTTQCPCSSYMGDRWPIMSRQSLMSLVPMSLIFMSEYPNRVQMCFDDILIEGGIHVLVVHYCISLVIHVGQRGLKLFHEKLLVTAVSQQRNVQLFTYSGGSARWLIMSRQNYF